MRTREGQSAKLEPRLAEIRTGRKHLIPGTVACYIVRDQTNVDEIQIILVSSHASVACSLADPSRWV